MSEKPGVPSPRGVQLRADAEAALAKGTLRKKSFFSKDRLLHELHVHQIELEMQNETLRQTQAELEESHQRYLALYDFAPVGYLTLTENCLINQINLTGAAMLQVERSNVQYSRFDHFVARKDVHRWQQWFSLFKQQSAVLGIELSLQKADKSTFYTRIECRLLATPGTGPLVYLTISDISERKQAELVLDDYKTKLEDLVYQRTAELVAKEVRISHFSRLTATLAAINKSVLRDASPDDLFMAACRAFVEQGGYKLACMGKVNSTGERVENAYSYGDCLEFLSVQAFDSQAGGLGSNTPAANAYHQQRVCICPDLRDELFMPDLRQKAEFCGIRAAIALPVGYAGAPWGVLSVYGEQPETFASAAQTVLEEIAQTLSFAIRYFAAEAQKKASVIALQESETLLQEAQRIAELGHWSYEPGSDRLTASAQLYRLYGRKPADDSLGLSDIAACYAPDSARIFGHAIQQALQDEERIELALQTKGVKGQIAHHALAIIPQVDAQGKIVRLYGTVQDVTEHKLTEEKLIHLAEQLFHSASEVTDLYQNAPCGYHSIDKNGVFCQINDTELAWLGYSRQEVVGKKNIADFLTPDSLKVFQANFPKLQQFGVLRDLEIEFVRKDGSLLSVLVAASAVYDAKGEFVMTRTTTYDMTERHKMESDRAKYIGRLADLSRHLVSVQEETRRQLAGELHDRTSPNLAAIDINFGIIARELPKEEFAAIAERLEDTQALIKDTAASIRDICADLRPPVLDYAGLGAALETYAQQFYRRTGIMVRMHCSNPAKRLAPDTESILFRIAQESLTNCAKHAHAKSIRIELDNEHSPIILSIVDDGQGFVLADMGKPGALCGLGILNMREMAEFAGGSFTLDSSPGQGTSVRVEIPVNEEIPRRTP